MPCLLPSNLLPPMPKDSHLVWVLFLILNIFYTQSICSKYLPLPGLISKHSMSLIFDPCLSLALAFSQWRIIAQRLAEYPSED